ncbi:MAG: EamA family transporter [Parcubacteria group bacterium]|jgi:drug/metabolite transporter (DMT)-like permease
MIFIFAALGSYFLGALTIILDKFLLGSKRITSAPVYSFFIALFGIFAVAFIPFVGFSIPSGWQIFLSLLGGALFSYGILALYFAIQKSEASRVSPIVGAVIPVATYFLSLIFSSEKLALIQIIGVALLIFGGLLISFDLPLKINKKKFFSGFYFSLSAGLLLALSYFVFKFVYNEQTFFNGFIWTRFGCFLAVMSYFLIPKWRKEICRSLNEFKKPKKKEYQTGGLFIGNKILGGTSSILLNVAIAMGSVTLVNSLVSSQYVFVLALAYFAHKKFPFAFQEKLYFWDWAQKTGAIVLIGVGIVFIFIR